MTFKELDARIRANVADDVERKQMLEGLHGIEEGMNLCATFWLSVSGYKIDGDDIYRRDERPTLFQVNI